MTVLYYHPESDSYFWDKDGIEGDGLPSIVTDYPDHVEEAARRGIVPPNHIDMRKKKMATVLMTPKFRVSFPNVFKPQKGQGENAKEKFGLTALFPHPEKMDAKYKAEYDAFMAKVKEAMQEAARTKWGDKIPKELRMPFRDQGVKDFEGYEEGALFAAFTSDYKPGLIDAQKNDIIDPSEFYPGCYARATINAYAYDRNGNRGIALGLNNIQKLADGDPLGGRTRAQDDFDAVDGAGSSSANALFE